MLLSRLFKPKTSTKVASTPSKVIIPRRSVIQKLTRGAPPAFKDWLDKPNIPETVANLPSTQVSELPNFMKVATEEHGGETATVGVFVDAGSAYETAEENGVAHFLEHMAFKGTANRTRKQLEEEIENMGGSLNAYTSRDHTVYYAKVFKNDVPKALEILSDILGNSTMADKDIERERSTILREMEEVNKDPAELIFDYLHAAAFQGQGLGRTILGPVENIKKIKRNDLVSYIKKYYQGHKMVVAGAGAVKHDNLVALTNKYFGHFPTFADKNRLPDIPDVITPEPATRYIGSQVLVQNDDEEFVHYAVAVEGVSWRHPDYFTMLLIQSMIGNYDKNAGAGKNLSSELAARTANEGFANAFNVFNTCYYDTGLFGVYANSEESVAEDFVYEFFNELQRITKYIGAVEVERAKERLKASLLLSLDGTTPTVEEMGRQVLVYKRRVSANEIFGRINAITVDDVRRVASEKFEDVDPVVVAYGPTHDFPDYNQIRNWTYWHRW